MEGGEGWREGKDGGRGRMEGGEGWTEAKDRGRGRINCCYNMDCCLARIT